MGFPIRKSPDQWIFAPPRSLSQLVASFIGSWCQGIPLALFIAWPIENKLFSLFSYCELCRLHRNFEIVIVTLHLFRCCSTIKIYVCFCTFSSTEPLCCLTSLYCYIVQFSRCKASNFVWSQISKSNRLGFEIQQQRLFGGPEWARTTDLAIISRTL